VYRRLPRGLSFIIAFSEREIWAVLPPNIKLFFVFFWGNYIHPLKNIEGKYLVFWTKQRIMFFGVFAVKLFPCSSLFMFHSADNDIVIALIGSRPLSARDDPICVFDWWIPVSPVSINKRMLSRGAFFRKRRSAKKSTIAIFAYFAGR
jgi:hypothetical protein